MPVPQVVKIALAREPVRHREVECKSVDVTEGKVSRPHKAAERPEHRERLLPGGLRRRPRRPGAVAEDLGGDEGHRGPGGQGFVDGAQKRLGLACRSRSLPMALPEPKQPRAVAIVAVAGAHTWREGRRFPSLCSPVPNGYASALEAPQG